MSVFITVTSQLRVYILQFWERIAKNCQKKVRIARKKVRIAIYKLAFVRKVRIVSFYFAILTLFLAIASLYHTILRKKSLNCEFISHSSDFISQNSEFISRNSDFVSRNCKFIYHNSEKKMSELKVCITQNLQLWEKLAVTFFIFIQCRKRASIVVGPKAEIIFGYWYWPKSILV